MKILYCITGLGIGGAEAITIDLANSMLELGHQVALVYLTGKNEQQLRISKGVETLGLGMTKNPVSFVRTMHEMAKFIRCWHPDVIHAQMTHASLFCRLLRLYVRIPFLICTAHNKYIGGKIRMFLFYLTDFLSDMNTNVSEEATQYFICQRAFSARKSRTVYNGIDLKKFIPVQENLCFIRNRYGIKENDFVFLNVGRLTVQKDQRSLIMAFQHLAQEYADVKLLIVGEGGLRGELEKCIVELGMEGCVVLVGNQQKMSDYYNAADCFVLSSAWEGFGIVLAEAMACELPVIATDSGGCAEVIDDMEYVVKPQDVGALFLKMKQVYEMPEEMRTELGRRNREKAMRFDIDRICLQWLDLYNSKQA